MRQKYFDITVGTYFIVSMFFANVLSLQQQQYRTDEISTNFGMHATENAQKTWKPISQSKWIILKTSENNVAANTAKEAEIIASNHHNSSKHSHSPPATPQQFKYQYWHEKDQQTLPAHLQTNYYAYNQNYNRHTGNYQQPTRTANDVKLIEPYIVTISKMRGPNVSQQHHNNAILAQPLTQGNLEKVFATAMPYVGAITLPKDVVRNAATTLLKKELRLDIKKEHISAKENFTDDANGESYSNIINVNIIDDIKHNGANFNDIFQPLHTTLDNIISFCDRAKHFIDDIDATDINDEDDIADEENNSNSVYDLFNILLTKITTTDEGVQGHHDLGVASLKQAQSRSSTSLSIIGTGRKIKKLKKKLSKFILPLLLAYKLKFLTLIPVLIGGLTLLVGTTGLAGFFFALFTAVMSLKSTGSSKSIIVKKI